MKIGQMVMVRDDANAPWRGPYVLTYYSHKNPSYPYFVTSECGSVRLVYAYARPATPDEIGELGELKEIPEKTGEGLPPMKLGDIVVGRDFDDREWSHPGILTGYAQDSECPYAIGGDCFRLCRLATEEEKAKVANIPQRVE